MKTLINIKKTWLPILSLGLLTVACSEDNSNFNEVTDDDLEFVAEVVGASLSSETDGVLASAYDASANVGSTGLTYGQISSESGSVAYHPGGPGEGPIGFGGKREHRGPGVNRNFNYNYDEATGTHTMTMERSIETERVTKSLNVTTKHIFTSLDDSFVRFPKENRDSINAIYFTSEKVGSDESPRRNGSFTKIDTMSVSGLDSTATTLQLFGSHYSVGSSTYTKRDSSTVDISHTVSITLTDVEIDKATIKANENLEEGVTGTITYSIVKYNSSNEEGEQTFEGTIEMTGDGTALLRFKKHSKIFRIALSDGRATDEGSES